MSISAAPLFQGTIALASSATMALSIDQSEIAPVTIAAHNGAVEPALQTMTMAGVCITDDLLHKWAADMRLKYADDELPKYIVQLSKPFQGGHGTPTLARAYSHSGEIRRMLISQRRVAAENMTIWSSES